MYRTKRCLFGINVRLFTSDMNCIVNVGIKNRAQSNTLGQDYSEKHCVLTRRDCAYIIERHIIENNFVVTCRRNFIKSDRALFPSTSLHYFILSVFFIIHSTVHCTRFRPRYVSASCLAKRALQTENGIH